MTIRHFFRPNEEVNHDPLHYTDCGLDNIYLRNGFAFEECDGERYLSITDLDGLHRAIGLHIVLAKKAPSGRELRFLRDEMDMTQAELAQVLGVSDQSVARWEKGQSEANGAAVFALRVIYVLSLMPEDERNEIMDTLLERLRELAAIDETSDDIVLTFSNDRWSDKAMAA